MDAGNPPDSRWLRRLARFVGLAAHDADDVAQSTLERWCIRRDDVDPRRGVEAWAFQVLINEARQHRRRTRGEVLMPFDDDDNVGDAGADPEARAILAAEIEVLRKLIAEIDASRRTIFVQHHLLEMSVVEIAEEYEIPHETVRTRLKLAAADFQAACSRLHARQRRRARFVPFPLALLDGTDWVRRRLGALRFPVAKIAAFVGSAAVVAASIALLTSRPPPQLIPAPILLRSRVAALMQPFAVRPAQPDASPPVVDTAATTPAACPSRPVREEPPGASPREESLIQRASAALEAGDTALALQLLGDHARQFRRGRLAPKREALLRTMH